MRCQPWSVTIAGDLPDKSAVSHRFTTWQNMRAGRFCAGGKVECYGFRFGTDVAVGLSSIEEALND